MSLLSALYLHGVSFLWHPLFDSGMALGDPKPFSPSLVYDAFSGPFLK